jgi:hypothetical protein
MVSKRTQARTAGGTVAWERKIEGELRAASHPGMDLIGTGAGSWR